jgi:hypothetical protein
MENASAVYFVRAGELAYMKPPIVHELNLGMLAS